MHGNELLTIALVLAAGIGCQWLAWRIRMPAILPLLAMGFVLGPVTGWLHPQDALGGIYFPIVSFAVAIILFEGALTLTWHELRTIASTVRNLLTVGAVVTWFGGAAAAYYIMGMDLGLSLLFGALIIVTGPTVIAPLLRNVRPTPRIGSVLKWEGILIDPVGATVAVLVFEFIAARVTAPGTAFVFLLIVAVGIVLGLASGYITYFLLRRYLVPDYLRDIFVLVVVLTVFAVSNTLAPESGLLTVTVMGIFLANTDLRQLREIWFFNEKLSVLLISTLFILLAANTSVDDLMLLNWRSLMVLLVVLFVLRPIGVQLSALGSALTRNERLFLSWIAPRGIVAAAISSLFAFELVEMSGYEEARIIAPLTLLVIVGTVLIQGGTAKWVATWLNVREAEPQGFLIMGGNEFAKMLALSLKESGFVVRMIDSNWERVREVRMQGLDIIHGNILSEATESALDLAGIGRLLALTRNDEANALACKHLEEDFGSSEVYQLPPKSMSNGQMPSRFQLGRLLATANATYENLHEMIDKGATIKKTQLTAEFTYSHFQERNVGLYVPLMLIRQKEVQVFTASNNIVPEAGWTLVSLMLDTNKPTVQHDVSEDGALAAVPERVI